MNGLKLAEEYFWRCGAPMIERRFADHRDRIAAGLVGDGSECFGFDDEISRDHDWGAGFCLWLNKEDFLKIGKQLHAEYDRLPREFAGFPERKISEWGEGRAGVFEIGNFYKRFIGCESLPASLQEWRLIPETYLAVCTNGKVFVDQLGEFSRFREKLLDYYPEDIRLKKIASRCMTIGRAGQYSFPRCVRHKEYVAAEYAKSMFIRDAISMVFLLNRKYMPYYKWMHRALKDLPTLGQTVHHMTEKLVTLDAQYDWRENIGYLYQRQSSQIEEICATLIGELRSEGLSDSNDDFLAGHGPFVQSKINNEEVRKLNVWIE
jgi:hypothetical protein